MKILVIAPSYRPFCDKRGSIEHLISMYLSENDKMRSKDEFYLYSPMWKKGLSDKDGLYKKSKFLVIDLAGILNKIIDMFLVRFYKYFRIGPGGLFIKKMVADYKKRGCEYDLIIFENGQNYIKYFNKRIETKAKKVLHLHNDYLNKTTPGAIEILHSFDEVWCVSKFIEDRISDIDNSYKNVYLLQNAIESIADQSENDVAAIRRELGIGDDIFVFGYVGRVIPEKGVAELVGAFNAISSTVGDKVRLVIVGGPVNHKSLSYYKKIRRTANKNVIFCGALPHEKVSRYYSMFDALVIPSLWNEAFGLVALEGMQYSMPIVATKVGGLPEVGGDSFFWVDRTNLVTDLEKQMIVVYSRNKKVDYSAEIKKFDKDSFCKRFFDLIHHDRKDRG